MSVELQRASSILRVAEDFQHVDVARLALGRNLAIDRLTFDGTEFTLVRNEDGAYRLQGAPAVSGEATTVQVPPDVDVLVRNSRVLYLDGARNVAWAFQDVVGSLRRDEGMLTVEASGLPPAEFAERIDVSAQAFVVDDVAGARFTGDWRLSAPSLLALALRIAAAVRGDRPSYAWLGRITHQLAQRLARADDVIVNDSDRADLDAAVAALDAKYRGMAPVDLPANKR